MNTKRLIILLFLAGLWLVGCSATGGEPAVDEVTPSGDAGLANPASVYCTEQGGMLEIRNDDSGGEVGYCVFDDGSECEEWVYFHGECASGNTQLFETLWVLQSYHDTTPLPGTTPTLTISPDWELNGSTGCNSFFGSVERTGEMWTVSPIGSTEMWCEGVMEQETAVLNALQNTAFHTLTAGQLQLHTPDGLLIYTPAENAALEGIQWQLSGSADGDAVVSSALDEGITIQLVEGEVSGFAGCNSFSGSYTIAEADHSLTFTPLAQTLMACADEDRMAREGEIMELLTQVAAYETRLDTLQLLDTDGNLLLTFQAAGLAE